jgi:hypothetical protein
MEELQQMYGSHDDSGEEDAAVWDGTVPDDADSWCAQLHRLISLVHGEGLETGVEPEWKTLNDMDFTESEEDRRGLPWCSLRPFLALPYKHLDEVTSIEYKTASRCPKLEALLFGTGETFGEWEAYTVYYPMADPAHQSLQVGQQVYVGKLRKLALVARILRGTKAAGKAGEGKTQQVYYVLIKDGAEFQYAALQHVRPAELEYEPSCTTEEWCDETPWHGAYAISSRQMSGFQPKSVAAVAKAAPQYVKSVSGQKRKRASPKIQSASKSARRRCRAADCACTSF